MALKFCKVHSRRHAQRGGSRQRGVSAAAALCALAAATASAARLAILPDGDVGKPAGPTLQPHEVLAAATPLALQGLAALLPLTTLLSSFACCGRGRGSAAAVPAHQAWWRPRRATAWLLVVMTIWVGAAQAWVPWAASPEQGPWGPRGAPPRVWLAAAAGALTLAWAFLTAAGAASTGGSRRGGHRHHHHHHHNHHHALAGGGSSTLHEPLLHDVYDSGGGIRRRVGHHLWEQRGCWNVLTFGWVTPLMRKGARRPLQERDLPPLAARLDPALCCNRIWAAWQAAALPGETPSPAHATTTITTTAARGDGSGHGGSGPGSIPALSRQAGGGLKPIPGSGSGREAAGGGGGGGGAQGGASGSTGGRQRLFWSLVAAHGREYAALGGLKLACDILSFAGPLLLNGVVRYINSPMRPPLDSPPPQTPLAPHLLPSQTLAPGAALASSSGVPGGGNGGGGWPWRDLDTGSLSFGGACVGLLFVTSLLKAVLSAQYSWRRGLLSKQLEAGLTCSVFRKVLLVSSSDLSSTASAGAVHTLMSVDAGRVVNLVLSCHELWSLPLQISAALVLLYTQVKYAFLAGLAVVLLLIPINRSLALRIQVASGDMMAAKDSRIKVMGEMLRGMRCVKVSCWEELFVRRVAACRRRELRALATRKYLDALCVYFWAATSLLFCLATFALYSLLGNTLTPEVAFTSLALFSVLIAPLNSFPWVVNGVVEALVSCSRLQRLLAAPETRGSWLKTGLSPLQLLPAADPSSSRPSSPDGFAAAAAAFDLHLGNDGLPPTTGGGLRAVGSLISLAASDGTCATCVSIDASDGISAALDSTTAQLLLGGSSATTASGSSGGGRGGGRMDGGGTSTSGGTSGGATGLLSSSVRPGSADGGDTPSSGVQHHAQHHDSGQGDAAGNGSSRLPGADADQANAAGSEAAAAYQAIAAASETASADQAIVAVAADPPQGEPSDVAAGNGDGRGTSGGGGRGNGSGGGPGLPPLPGGPAFAAATAAAAGPSTAKAPAGAASAGVSVVERSRSSAARRRSPFGDDRLQQRRSSMSGMSGGTSGGAGQLPLSGMAAASSLGSRHGTGSGSLMLPGWAGQSLRSGLTEALMQEVNQNIETGVLPMMSGQLSSFNSSGSAGLSNSTFASTAAAAAASSSGAGPPPVFDPSAGSGGDGGMGGVVTPGGSLRGGTAMLKVASAGSVRSGSQGSLSDALGTGRGGWGGAAGSGSGSFGSMAMLMRDEGMPKGPAIRLAHAFFTWRRAHTGAGNGSNGGRGIGGGDGGAGDSSGHAGPAPHAGTPPPFAPLPGDLTSSVLRDVTFSAPPGTLVALTGEVGSGKSSLLLGLLGELRLASGEAQLSGAVGFVGQHPWIMSGTLRENVLFGAPYDEARYDAVLKASALSDDVAAMPSGDLTRVGDRGGGLSGGQRVRVSLARAMYQDCDVYLLDDVFSALDAHVASHVFEHALMGLMEGSTRLLAGHYPPAMAAANMQVDLYNGAVSYCGTPREGLGRISEGVDTETSKAQAEAEGKQQDAAENGDAQAAGGTEGQPNGDSGGGSGGSSSGGGDQPSEEREVGHVQAAVWLEYARATGWGMVAVILISLVLMQASRNANDLWLSYWVSQVHSSSPSASATMSSAPPLVPFAALGHSALHAVQAVAHGGSGPAYGAAGAWWQHGGEAAAAAAGKPDRQTDRPATYYLLVLVAIAAANSVFTLARAFSFAYGGVRAARRLHRRLLDAVVHAPMRFFETTPTGRIINRFSSDTSTSDDSLPFILNILLANAAGLAGVAAVLCWTLPVLLALLLPLCLVYRYLQLYYRCSSRELRRLEALARSPVYSTFSEVLEGAPVVRAYGRQPHFATLNQAQVAALTRAGVSSLAASLWLGLRLELIACTVVTAIGMLALASRQGWLWGSAPVDAGLLGLSLAYALPITGLLNGLLSSSAETEQEMVAVERLGQYLDLEPEPDRLPPFDASPPPVVRPPTPGGPHDGEVVFRDVFLTYPSTGALALQGVSFRVAPRERVGIVGRTGAGKSSILNALLRLTDISGGCIAVNGINAASLPLRALRSQVAVVGQAPFLFEGSIRDNLDPEGRCTDGEMIGLLKRLRLWDVLSALFLSQLKQAAGSHPPTSPIPLGAPAAAASAGSVAGSGSTQGGGGGPHSSPGGNGSMGASGSLGLISTSLSRSHGGAALSPKIGSMPIMGGGFARPPRAPLSSSATIGIGSVPGRSSLERLRPDVRFGGLAGGAGGANRPPTVAAASAPHPRIPGDMPQQQPWAPLQAGRVGGSGGGLGDAALRPQPVLQQLPGKQAPQGQGQQGAPGEQQQQQSQGFDTATRVEHHAQPQTTLPGHQGDGSIAGGMVPRQTAKDSPSLSSSSDAAAAFTSTTPVPGAAASAHAPEPTSPRSPKSPRLQQQQQHVRFLEPPTSTPRVPPLGQQQQQHGGDGDHPRSTNAGPSSTSTSLWNFDAIGSQHHHPAHPPHHPAHPAHHQQQQQHPGGNGGRDSALSFAQGAGSRFFNPQLLSIRLGEDGGGLSQGQRQLLCLARALLRRCRILALDEPTASVDPANAAWIHQVLDSVHVSGGGTVLQVAHRLEHVMGYDRVLVMDSGRVVEEGAPSQLLEQRGSRFATMHCAATQQR